MSLKATLESLAPMAAALEPIIESEEKEQLIPALKEAANKISSPDLRLAANDLIDAIGNFIEAETAKL